MLTQSVSPLTKSNHRLETVSLSQALAQSPVRLATGITSLDDALSGGFRHGQISEIYGSPGSGKTALAMQVAAGVLAQGHGVTWLECSGSLPASRLRDFLSHALPSQSEESHDGDREDVRREEEEEGDDSTQESMEERALRRVHVLSTPTLTSLLALLASAETLVSRDSRLLVLDDATTLFTAAFPPDSHRETTRKRVKMANHVGDALSRLACHSDLVILLLAKLTSRIVRGGPAQLESPFGDSWVTRCASRVTLYRDDLRRRASQGGEEEDVRWVAVQRTGGRNVFEPKGMPFRILGSGLVSVEMEEATLSRSQTPRPSSVEHGITSRASSSGLVRLREDDSEASQGALKKARTIQDDGEDVDQSDDDDDVDLYA